MRFFYPPEQLQALRLDISIYALTRFNQGLAGLPMHPHNSDSVSIDQIARDTGQDKNALRAIVSHIQVLFKQYKLPDGLTQRQSVAIATIKATYHNRPMPMRPCGAIDFNWISFETQICEAVLRHALFEPVIQTLAAQNGVIHIKLSLVQKLKILAEYVSKLRVSTSPVPWNARFQVPSYAEISRATGLEQRDLRTGELNNALMQLIRDLPREESEPFEQQVDRLSKHVDLAICEGVHIPRGFRGIGYTAIGSNIRIAAHRLRNVPRFRAEIDRWLEASLKLEINDHERSTSLNYGHNAQQGHNP